MKIIERIRLGDRGKGSLLRYEDSANWTFSYYQAGKEHRVSAKTADEKVARRFARQRLDEVSADRQGLKKLITPLAARMTVDELLDAYLEDLKLRGSKSIYKSRMHAKSVREHFGSMRASSVTAEAIDKYVTAKLKAGKSNGTINKGTTLLATAFKLAHQRKRVGEVPLIRKLPETNVRQGFYEEQEINAVLEALPEHLRDLVRFGYVTGWRRGEITRLRWEWVDMAAGTITLPTTKNGRARVLHLAGDVLEILRRREANRLVERDGNPVVSDHVFHWRGRGISDFQKAWHSALVRAGLSHTEKVGGKVVTVYDRCFHDLRRTAARNMLRAGVREGVAMQVTGHKTRSMLERYAIVAGDDLRDAMEKVSAPRAS